MLTHHNLIATAESYLQVDLVSVRDEIMAYLPMAWIGDTFFSVVLSFSPAQLSIVPKIRPPCATTFAKSDQR